MDFLEIKNELVEIQKKKNYKSYFKLLVKNLSGNILLVTIIYVIRWKIYRVLEIVGIINYVNKITSIYKQNNLTNFIKELTIKILNLMGLDISSFAKGNNFKEIILNLLKTSEGKFFAFILFIWFYALIDFIITLAKRSNNRGNAWQFVNNPLMYYKYRNFFENFTKEDRIKMGVLEWNLNKYSVEANYRGGFLYPIIGLVRLYRYNNKLGKYKIDEKINYGEYYLEEKYEVEIEEFENFEEIDNEIFKINIESVKTRLFNGISIYFFISIFSLFVVGFLNNFYMINIFKIMVPLWGIIYFIMTICEEEYLVLHSDKIEYEIRVFSKIRKRIIFEKKDKNYFDIIKIRYTTRSHSVYYKYKVVFNENDKIKYRFKNDFDNEEALSLCKFLNELLISSLVENTGKNKITENN